MNLSQLARKLDRAAIITRDLNALAKGPEAFAKRQAKKAARRHAQSLAGRSGWGRLMRW